MAKRYHSRPSELLAIDDAYSAYCLDEAVFTFCAGVEAKIEEVPMGKGKKAHEKRERAQKEVLQRLLKIKDKVKQKFRDPAEMMRR